MNGRGNDYQDYRDGFDGFLGGYGNSSDEFFSGNTNLPNSSDDFDNAFLGGNDSSFGHFPTGTGFDSQSNYNGGTGFDSQSNYNGRLNYQNTLRYQGSTVFNDNLRNQMYGDYVSVKDQYEHSSEGDTSHVPAKASRLGNIIITTLLFIAVMIPLLIIYIPSVAGLVNYNNLIEHGDKEEARVVSVRSEVKTSTSSKGRTTRRTVYHSDIQYTHNGKSYSKTFSEKFTKGQTITIYVDPSNPKNCVYEGQESGSIVLIIILSVVILAIIITTIFNLVRKPKLRKRFNRRNRRQ